MLDCRWCCESSRWLCHWFSATPSTRRWTTRWDSAGGIFCKHRLVAQLRFLSHQFANLSRQRVKRTTTKRKTSLSRPGVFCMCKDSKQAMAIQTVTYRHCVGNTFACYFLQLLAIYLSYLEILKYASVFCVCVCVRACVCQYGRLDQTWHWEDGSTSRDEHSPKAWKQPEDRGRSLRQRFDHIGGFLL